MEFILQNTDIFDEEIGLKFNNLLVVDSFIKENVYRLTVRFHVNLLSAYTRFKEFNIPVSSTTNKGTKEDKGYDVMTFQLKEIEQILDENGIEVSSATIQGDYLKAEDIIKIEIAEDISKPYYSGRGKNKKRMKLIAIMPNLPYIQTVGSELPAKILGEIFNEFKWTVGNKFMSEILEIETTNEREKLIDAFVKQYGDLWSEPGIIRKQLIEKSQLILNKHLEEEKD